MKKEKKEEEEEEDKRKRKKPACLGFFTFLRNKVRAYKHVWSWQQEKRVSVSNFLLKQTAGTCTVLENETNCGMFQKKIR